MKPLLAWRISIILISILAGLWVIGPRLTDEFQVDQDQRYFFWMHKFQDPTLFPNDKLMSPTYTTLDLPGIKQSLYIYPPGLGYVWLFQAVSPILSSILFSKILFFLLMPLTVLYLLEFGRSAYTLNTGIFLAVSFIFLSLVSSSSLSLVSGLQRSFAVSLIIVLVYYLDRQKYLGAAVVTILSALIFAPVFVLAVITWASMLLIQFWQFKKLDMVRHNLAVFLAATTIGSLSLLPAILPRVLDKRVESTEAEITAQPPAEITDVEKPFWEEPHYKTGGSEPVFFWFPFVGRGGLVNQSEEVANLLILLSLSGLIVAARGRRVLQLPAVLWSLLGATMIAFSLAWMAAWLANTFILYYPSRYSRVGLFIFFFMFVVLNGGDALKEALTSIQHHPKRLAWLAGGVLTLIFGLVFLYPSDFAKINNFNMKWLLAPVGLIFVGLSLVVMRRTSTPALPDFSRLQRAPAGRVLLGLSLIIFLLGWAPYTLVINKVDLLNPSEKERALLKFIETLPKDALLAGTPCLLDNVQLFAKRDIVFSCKLPNADDDLILEALDAYYAEEAQAIYEFCTARQVSYLVIDQEAYSKEYFAEKKIFYEPYQSQVMSRIIEREYFVLAEIPDDIKLFQSGDYFVMPCDATLLQL